MSRGNPTRARWRFAILSLVLQLHSHASRAAAISERRVITASATVTLKLNCTGEGPQWYINGDFITTNNLTTLGISVVHETIRERTDVSKLQFNVTVISNGTEIECRVRAGSEITTAESVTFIIQGPLDPPGNFHIIPIHSSLLQLRWNEPFSLDLTDHDPDISGYSINISNLNTGLKMQVNTTERSYHFSGIPKDGEKPYPCNLYEFSIRARNVGGLGNSSRKVTESFPEIPHQVHADPEDIKMVWNEPPFVSITIEVNTTCDGKRPDNITIILKDTDHSLNRSEVIGSSTVTKIPEKGKKTYNLSVEFNTSGNDCTVQFIAANTAGRSSNSVNFDCSQLSSTNRNDDDDNVSEGRVNIGVIIGAVLGTSGMLILVAIILVIIKLLLGKRQTKGFRSGGTGSTDCESNDYEENDVNPPPHNWGSHNTQQALSELHYADIGQPSMNQQVHVCSIPLKPEVEYAQLQRAE